MLAVASPIALQSPASFSRTSKDTDASHHSRAPGLDAILEDTVEFVEGSSTGALVQAETKYPYINVPNDEHTRASRPSSPSKPPTNSIPPPSPHGPRHSLYNRPIITAWTMPRETSTGFINTGNTCFLNSVLQCLIHTPPLQRVLEQHDTSDDKCRVPNGFCMACALGIVMNASFKKTSPFIPGQVIKNLSAVAKHMRIGRQEDAHEFLRYSVDALQRTCLAGHSPKIDPRVAETTWVHRLFGGRLRSRVICNTCNHPSDTFDAILDLSLDIQNVGSLKHALTKFVQVDHLRGANKYKCERCQKPVNAEKQFTVHDAPVCLTVHLKRFTPLGRKIGHAVDYMHALDLQPAMSEGQHGPRYALYGVISHAGSGPNSGHYYAHVKGGDGHWYEANDETVTRCGPGAVVGRKTAYMLFYMRQQGDALGEAIGMRGGGGANSGTDRGAKRETSAKRDGEEDRGVVANGASKSDFIGPRRPSPPPPRPDPQAVALQAKIAKAKAESARGTKSVSLVPAYSSDAEEEEGEIRERVTSVPPSSAVGPGSSPIPPDSFYGSAPPKKRKSSNRDDEQDTLNGGAKRRRSSPPSQNVGESQSQSQGQRPHARPSIATPFSTASMSNNLHASREQGKFDPPHRSRGQKIAGVGQYLPARRGLASKMKTKSLM